MFINLHFTNNFIFSFLKEKRLPFDQFGFFVGKNESTDGNITILTGKSDVFRIGEVLAFNGKKRLSFWDGEECNKIR